LGQTAPNPVLITLRWFRNEYEAHVYDRACPAKACLELRTFRINVDKCKGCAACVKKCPSKAIFGAPKSPHYIVENVCVSCGTCMEACRFEAIEVA
jgi:Na+-translocating ferredoxin:NAD+ oxidoreductase RNF subunit RnfB